MQSNLPNDDFDEFFEAGASTSNLGTMSVENQVDRYLLEEAEPTIGSACGILSFWKAQSSSYPQLANVEGSWQSRPLQLHLKGAFQMLPSQ